MTLRVALAQINPTVGDIDGNSALIAQSIEQAGNLDCSLVVLPEMAILGYPPRDLLLKPSVIEQCHEAVAELASRCTGSLSAIIGFPRPASGSSGRTLHNSAAFCRAGRAQAYHDKSLLPTYDVFDELRYFEPGPAVDVTEFDDLKLGISICEDLWNDSEVFSRQLYHDNPIDELAKAGADLFINCAASPFVIRKAGFRRRLMCHAARRYRLPLIYCNQVGGNDELVFDGGSCVIDRNGNVVAQALSFASDLLVVDAPIQQDDAPGRAISAINNDPTSHTDAAGPAGTPVIFDHNDDPTHTDAGNSDHQHIDSEQVILASSFHALSLGIADYCRKCGFESIVIGLSGGIDSALTACLCVQALGADKVRGVAMPSRYSSKGSMSDAKELAENLGIQLDVVPIAEPHAAMESLLRPHFDDRPPDTTEENIQARLRGVILMAFSNKFGSLLVTTGNKSELAVGYCTLYGDMAGGLAAISDVPKTMVYRLSRWINDSPQSPLRKSLGIAPIPSSTITKPPSAELRPDQTDQDSLPGYDVLDDIVERYVEREQSARQIIDEAGYDPQTVQHIVRLIDRNEYKRKQAAPGLKITGRAFGVGRRMPIAQRYNSR